MRLLLLLLLSVALFAGEAAKPAMSPKEQDIRKLLTLTKAEQMGIQVIEQMISVFRNANPTVGEQFWTELRNEIKPGEILEKVVPIYDRHLSHDDVKATLAFYESAAGKRMLEAQPRLFHESMTVGQEWGTQQALKVQKKLTDAGFPPPAAPAPAPAPAPKK